MIKGKHHRTDYKGTGVSDEIIHFKQFSESKNEQRDQKESEHQFFINPGPKIHDQISDTCLFNMNTVLIQKDSDYRADNEPQDRTINRTLQKHEAKVERLLFRQLEFFLILK